VELLGVAGWHAVHRRARLGQEVLHDHFLHVPVAQVCGPDGKERVDALGARLADPHEDPGGEWHPGLPGGFEGGESTRGRLVGRTVVRPARLAEPCSERLDHHALGRRDRAEALELLARERARVRVGEEPGVLEDGASCVDEVVDGRRVAAIGQPRRGRRVTLLGRLAQGEQGLVAPEGRAVPGHGHDRVEVEEGSVEPGRWLGERAVAAPVATEHGEGDEDLRGERDAVAVATVALLRRLGDQRLGRQPDQLAGFPLGEHDDTLDDAPRDRDRHRASRAATPLTPSPPDPRAR